MAVSRDTHQICRTCGVYESGDGLNATLMDRCDTLEEWDAEWRWLWPHLPWDEWAANNPDHVNVRIRRFIVRHAGHQIEHWSWDWVYDEDDPLKGLQYEHAAPPSTASGGSAAGESERPIDTPGQQPQGGLPHDDDS